MSGKVNVFWLTSLIYHPSLYTNSTSSTLLPLHLLPTFYSNNVHVEIDWFTTKLLGFIISPFHNQSSFVTRPTCSRTYYSSASRLKVILENPWASRITWPSCKIIFDATFDGQSQLCHHRDRIASIVDKLVTNCNEKKKKFTMISLRKLILIGNYTTIKCKNKNKRERGEEERRKAKERKKKILKIKKGRKIDWSRRIYAITRFLLRS